MLRNKSKEGERVEKEEECGGGRGAERGEEGVFTWTGCQNGSRVHHPDALNWRDPQERGRSEMKEEGRVEMKIETEKKGKVEAEERGSMQQEGRKEGGREEGRREASL